MTSQFGRLRAVTRPSPTQRAGFSLVELLIVIGVIALLVGILLPTLSTAREQSRRVVCAGNLRQAGVALIGFASEHNKRFPVYDGPTNYLWDIPIGTRDALVKYGATRDTMYCPSGDPTQNSDEMWTFNDGSGNTFCVSGYFWLTPRLATNKPQLPASKGYVTSLAQATNPAETELATDAVISSLDYTFTDVPGSGRSHRSNHIRHTTDIAGGNILFLDGRVEWRDLNIKQDPIDPWVRVLNTVSMPNHYEWY